MGRMGRFVKMDVMTMERPYAGLLAEQRKQVRRDSLIAAGLELLGTQGAAATSVRAVCRQAGLSSRYFYESFANLDELLVAVFDHLMQGGISRAISETLEFGGDLRTTISAVATAFAGTLNDPRAMRVLLIEAWGSETLTRRRVETLHQGAAMLAAAVKRDRSQTTDTRVEIAAFTIMGGLLETVLAWTDGALGVPLEQVLEQFTDISVAAMEHALASSTKPSRQ
jgi:AcrR family transcriptional regulator